MLKKIKYTYDKYTKYNMNIFYLLKSNKNISE